MTPREEKAKLLFDHVSSQDNPCSSSTRLDVISSKYKSDPCVRMKKRPCLRIGSLSLSFSSIMKFGKTILRNQLPEWSKNYIAYKALKKSINEAAAGELPPSEEVITGTFKTILVTMGSLTWL